MTDLPTPLVPAGVDLRHYPCMNLDVKRLRDSRFAVIVSGEGFRCGLLLWAAAWHQVPAGSLPDDDVELSSLAGFGRAVSAWREHRTDALYGWVKCSDSRLYHPVVAEKAVEAWNTNLLFRWKKETDRIRKENKAREERGLPPLETPAKPLEIRVGTSTTDGLSECVDGHGEGVGDPETPGSAENTGNDGTGEAFRASPPPVPTETDGASDGTPTENPLNVTERNGVSPSCPKPASLVRTRRRYPEDFERFWSAYPTDANMSKIEAGKVWSRITAEDRELAMAAVPNFIAYCQKRPDYRIVHAQRYLSTRRFDGHAATKTDPDTSSGPSLPVFEVRGRQVPSKNILDTIERWQQGGGWPEVWGAPPGNPACRIPRQILERAGVAP